MAYSQVHGGVAFDDARISVLGGNLTISSARKEDHGAYQCVASNIVATVLADTKLVIFSTSNWVSVAWLSVPWLSVPRLSCKTIVLRS